MKRETELLVPLVDDGPADHDVLDPVVGPSPAPLAFAFLVTLEGHRATLAWPSGHTVTARVARHIDIAWLQELANGRLPVIVEQSPIPTIVGALQTGPAQKQILSGDKVTIEAREEILLRAGRTAIRLRSDGDLELVGNRVSATSRGLMRLVGRILRLN